MLRELIVARDRALEERSQNLARERERGDVLQREALARIEALIAGPIAPSVSRPSDPVALDQFAGESDLTVPTEIHKGRADLTDQFIAELAMDHEVALIAAAAELGIPYGD